MVPEADHAITFALKDCGSGCIDHGLVLPAIDFDNDFRPMACKVRDEMPDWNLAPKMMLAEGFSQYPPKALLCVG